MDVQHYSAIDVVLSIMVSAIVTLGAIVGFFLKTRMKSYDDHITNSALDKQKLALQDQRLGLLQQQMAAHEIEDDTRFHDLKKSLDRNNRTTEWLGDCMVANQLKQPFPPRP